MLTSGQPSHTAFKYFSAFTIQLIFRANRFYIQWKNNYLLYFSNLYKTCKLTFNMTSCLFLTGNLATHQNTFEIFDIKRNEVLFLFLLFQSNYLLHLKHLTGIGGPSRSKHFVMGSVNTEKANQVRMHSVLICWQCEMKARCNKICARSLLRVSCGRTVISKRSSCDGLRDR